MRGLLLAEKPSVMRAIKEVYEHEKALPYQLDFGAFHGHLMELKAPEDYDSAWADRDNVAILPLVPEQFAYKESDKASVDKLMNKIKGFHYDFLVNACDAGREGEHIFWSFYETMGLTLPVKRLWITSVTKPAIKKGLNDLKDSNLYSGMRQASKYRAQFDWLVGMNFTRAASIAMHRFVTVGRVQSPTLKLIVDREKEIQAFKPESYYEVTGEFTMNGGSCEAIHIVSMQPVETRLKNKADADAVVSAVQQAGTGEVVAMKESVHSMDAPTLYSITELQKDANKYFKFKPDKTLAIAQKLYEDGLLTYPRTESRSLPTDMISELPQHIAPLHAVPELAPYASKITKAEIDEMLKKNYVDDAGVTDHHAIIPTDQAPNMASLSSDEAAIYTLVGKSFLAIFMPPYKTANSTVLIKVGTRLFRAQGSKEVDKGFAVLYPAKGGTGANILPKCSKGDKATVKKVAAQKKTTKAPRRLTPRTILSLMINAGQDLPDSAMRSVLKETKGLGTPATRSEILKRLEERGYVEVKGNAYYALDKGISLIDAISDRTFCSALLTAQWEEKLLKIESGAYKNDFRKEMEDYVRKETASLLADLKASAVGNCPICGGDVITIGKAFICSNRRKDDSNSCQFWLPQTIGGATLSKEDIEALLSGQKTNKMSVQTKAKTTWETRFFLDPNTHKLMAEKNFEPPKTIGACPACGKPVYARENNVFCSGNKDKSCSWSMARAVKGRRLEDQDIKALIGYDKTRPLSFTWSNGKRGKAKLYLNCKDQSLCWEFMDT
jgi:DNA topoisomerase-3